MKQTKRRKAYQNRYKLTKPFIYKDGNEWVLFKGGFSCFMDNPKDCLIKASSLNHYEPDEFLVIRAAIAVVIIIVCVATFLFSPPSKADIYIKIGSGYKLIETDHIVRTTGEKVYFNTGGKLSARIEIGKEHGRWSYGISHHSQWLSGFPINEDGNEYQKTELFADYKWTL